MTNGRRPAAPLLLILAPMALLAACSDADERAAEIDELPVSSPTVGAPIMTDTMIMADSAAVPPETGGWETRPTRPPPDTAGN